MKLYFLLSKGGYYLRFLPVEQAPAGLEVNILEKKWEYKDPKNKRHSSSGKYEIGSLLGIPDNQSWVRGVYDIENPSHLENAIEMAERHYSDNPGNHSRPGETI